MRRVHGEEKDDESQGRKVGGVVSINASKKYSNANETEACHGSEKELSFRCEPTHVIDQFQKINGSQE